MPALGAGVTHSGTTGVTIPAGTAAGAYYILVKADADNLVLEVNEGNNFVPPARAITVGTDMIIGLDVPASAGTIPGGSTVPVTDVTRNNRAVTVPASTTRFYLSSNPVLDAGDVLVGSRGIPALGPDTESTGTTGVTIPTGLEGTYYLIAKADADNTVVEMDEGNNTAVSQALIVGGALWDLVAWLELPSGATAVMPGGTISVIDYTKAENVAAPASTTGIYLSANATWEAGDVRLGSRAVPALGAGVTHSGTTGVTIPAGTAAGAYYILVKADADNLVLELNEGNNFVPPARAITVGTDMIIGLDVPAAAGTIAGGATVPVTDVTRNNRAVAVPASTTRFYLSSNPVLDAGDVLVGSRAIPALGPDTESTGTTGVMIPTGLEGTYYLLAKADADNTVVEIDEGNNTAVSQALVVGGAWGPRGVAGAAERGDGGDAGRDDLGGRLHQGRERGGPGVDDGDLPVGERDVGGGGRAAREPGGAGARSGGDALGTTGVTIPAGTAAGAYYILVKADADNLMLELNEGNNFVPPARAITVGTDMIIGLDVPASAGTIAGGATVPVTDVTRNNRAVAVPASTTRFYLSSNPVLDAGDVLVGSRGIPALGPDTESTGTTGVTIPTGLGGTYYLIAKADADNTVVEIDEGNNTAVSQAFVIGGDLIVYLDLPAASMEPPVGGTISIDDHTRNDSGAPAAASTTAFFLSADTVLGAGDTLLGSRPVPALAPGATSVGSTSLTLPAGVSGTYYIIARADGADAVVEANESNNVTATSLPVAIGPDLVIAGANIPAMVRAGVSVSISETTKNQGGGTAGPSTTRFYLSVDSTVSADDLILGSRAVAALGASNYTSGTTAVVVPAGTPAGSYRLISVADAANAVGEAVESNNTLVWWPVEVVPDLTVPTIDAPSKAYPGTTLTVTDTTTNGGAASPPTTTRLYLSGDTILDAGDLVVGSRAVPALAFGQSHSASTQVALAADLPGGVYYLIALGDPDNIVVEWSETNNTRYKSLTIGPDLTVAALSGPASAAKGTVIMVTDTTSNLGSAAASSTVRYFLSTNSTLDGGDLPLGSRTVPVLGLGATSVETVALTLPAGVSGSFFVIAQADADSTVAELVETNNTRSRAISITP